MLLKKSGVLFLDGDPKYMVDELDDDMLAFYFIKKESKDDFERTKEIDALAKDYVFHYKKFVRPKYKNVTLNQYVKNHFKSKKMKKGYVKEYSLPAFVSNIVEAKDYATDKYTKCFEFTPDNKSTGIYISLNNIVWKDKVDVDFEKISELIYYNELIKYE